jgi:hypothetical protein
MYRSLPAVWNGFSKNAGDIIHATSLLHTLIDALKSIGLAAGTLLPFIMLSNTVKAGTTLWSSSLLLSIFTLTILSLSYILALRALRVPFIYFITMPFGLAMHGAIIINAYYRNKTGKREWKGRHY